MIRRRGRGKLVEESLATINTISSSMTYGYAIGEYHPKGWHCGHLWVGYLVETSPKKINPSVPNGSLIPGFSYTAMAI
jgi:hypothetical protein